MLRVVIVVIILAMLAPVVFLEPATVSATPEWPVDYVQVICFQPNSMINETILPNRT
jgi:hypothetical protein